MSRTRALVITLAGALLVACGESAGSPLDSTLTEPAPPTGAAPTIAETTVTETTVPGTVTIIPTDTPVDAPVPDDFALRDEYPSCGEDFSLELDTVGPPSKLRQCFLDANTSAKPAELSAYESTELNADGPRLLVYRTNRDRSVDVFIPGLGRPGDQPWRTIHCVGPAPDDRRVFVLTGCGEPVDVD